MTESALTEGRLDVPVADLPQVAELDLNPVIARPDGVVAVDARIRVTSHGSADPFLRQLRSAPRPQS